MILNLLTLVWLSVVMILFLFLGYKIYQKGLKDGLSIKKDDVLSPEPLFNLPTLPELPHIETKEEKLDRIEAEQWELYGSADENDIKRIQDLEKEKQKLR